MKKFMLCVLLIGCGTAEDINNQDPGFESGSAVTTELVVKDGNGAVIGELVGVHETPMGTTLIKAHDDGLVFDINPTTGFVTGGSVESYKYGSSDCSGEWMAAQVPDEFCAPFPMKRVVASNQEGWVEGNVFIYGQTVAKMETYRNEDHDECTPSGSACMVELIALEKTSYDLPISID